MSRVEVDIHPLEPRQTWELPPEAATRGPLVVGDSRGEHLAWILGPSCEQPQGLGRTATPQDLQRQHRQKLFSQEVASQAHLDVAELELPMTIVEARQTLGGELIIVYFSAPERVDFRPLVQSLAGRYRKKLELYQLSDRQRVSRQSMQGRCGLECCCSAWLREFPSVSVRLAEEQGLSLQPEAITGVCGRLLCCLRYEYEGWLEKRRLPQVGDRVETPAGTREVLEIDPHTRTLKVTDPERGVISIPWGRTRNPRNCTSCKQGPEGEAE